MQQAWLTEPDPNFLPGRVRFGWQPDALCVLAELSDREIASRARAHNERMWLLGDVFELFLRDSEGEAYHELHITPDNFHLQLRFPDAKALRSGQPLASFLLDQQVFEHGVFLNPDQQCWTVFAKVPQAIFRPASIQGRVWYASFSRYDYPSSCEKPASLSSTSAHSKLDFHAQVDWRPIVFS